MADKDDDKSRNSSPVRSENDDPTDTERQEAGIPSIPPIDTPINGEDNAAAIELFLEQVAAATTNSILSGLAKEEKALDKERELKRAKRMIIPPECKCHLNGGEPCHTRFSVGELMDTRMHYMSISKKELDIAVLAKLECGIHLTKMTTRKKRRPTERKKHRTDFYHRGFRICNMIFVYLHGFSYKKLKALIQQYKVNGVMTRVHKNFKPKPLDGEPKVKKKKPKQKPKPKEGKPRKPRIRKNKSSKSGNGLGLGGGESKEIVSSAQLYPNLNPAKLPPPTLHPPPHHPSYPVGFSMTTPSHVPQPSPFMNPQHSSPPTFPHAVGYNNGPVFPPHPMARHNPHVAHPSVSSHNNPPLDFSNQRGMPTNPPIDYSNQSSSPSSTMQGFQGSNRPCMTYSVVHSVAF